MNNIGIINDYKSQNHMQELKASLKNYSTSSIFEDDTWVLDKLKKSEGHTMNKCTLWFSPVIKEHRDITKYFALIRLGNNISVSTVGSNIYGLKVFYNFLYEVYRKIPLNKLNKSIIMDFEDYLRKESFKKSTKEIIWSSINIFFPTMKNWDGMPDIKVVDKYNPFSRTAQDRIINDKYIPEYVIKQLDEIFMDEELPLHFRVLYWICRLIPSRVGEVTSININCLVPYGNEYALKLNMYKQNGGYLEPETRIIALKYEDMGKYLIDLINLQREKSIKLQKYLPNEKKGYLFTYIPEVYVNGKYVKKQTNFQNHITILNERIVGKFFRTLCSRYEIVDENNKPYIITSHKLRHNAITDRIYEGFSLLQIRDMTGHKTTAMLTQSYIHYDNDKIIEKANLVNKNSKEEVYFKGRILNPENENMAKRLLERPRAHKIGKLGICSDISGCKNDMYECLNDCEYFIPNAEEMDYFEEQVHLWEEKVKTFANHPYMKENAEYNLKIHKNIVNRLKNGLEGVR